MAGIRRRWREYTGRRLNNKWLKVRTLFEKLFDQKTLNQVTFVIDPEIGSIKAVIPAEAGIHFKKHGCPTTNLGHDENHLFSCPFVSQELISIPAGVYLGEDGGGNDEPLRTLIL